jgi:hypothetical protein
MDLTGMPTLLDLALQKGNDQIVGLIEESIRVNPEIGLFPARTISGTSYKTLVRTGFPTVRFRGANEGSARSKSTFEQRNTECFIIDSQVAADKMLADAWEPGGAAAYQMIEAQGTTEGALRTVARQIYYGNSAAAVTAGLGDAKGFPGFIDAYDETDHQVDATGSTAKTSVWAVKLGVKDVHLIGGGNKTLDFAMDEWRIQTVQLEDNLAFTAYVNQLNGWIGMQVGSVHSLVRIKNIGTDVGKGMTDSLGQQAIEKFPSGVAPDYFIMNRRSRRQLHDSRTSIAGTGGGILPGAIPLPTSIEGIPIIVTDALSIAEGTL